MNKERLTELANFFEASQFHFDMAKGMAEPSCGTAGCIGGHAAILWPEVRTHNDECATMFTWDDAALNELLGITDDKGDQLFYPRGDYWADDEMVIAYDEITKAGALTTLRRFAETGEIVWNKSEQV